jgi:hypothetical protein
MTSVKVYPPAATGMKRIYFIGLGREADYSFEDTKECFARHFTGDKCIEQNGYFLFFILMNLLKYSCKAFFRIFR